MVAGAPETARRTAKASGWPGAAGAPDLAFAGLAAAGLPIGSRLLAHAGQESLLLAAAAQLET